MNRALRVLLLCCLGFLTAGRSVCLADPSQPDNSNGAQILQQFGRQQPQTGPHSSVIPDHEKQVIMFSLGLALLVLLIGTASVGIAFAAFGKPLFLVHMILAGLTVTVALIHAVVGVVWFFPF
jgi:hypothetical protein